MCARVRARGTVRPCVDGVVRDGFRISYSCSVRMRACVCLPCASMSALEVCACRRCQETTSFRESQTNTTRAPVRVCLRARVRAPVCVCVFRAIVSSPLLRLPLLSAGAGAAVA
eukprot:6210572-Pleurochrysis_carterae.AAC.2